MSETAVATKPAKSAAPVAAPAIPTPVREVKLREAQAKKFPPSALKALGYGETDMLTATAPAGMSFADVMLPIAWANTAHMVARDALNSRNMNDGMGCLIILDSSDNTYHAHLRIRKVVRDHVNGPCGLEVVCIGPSIDLKTGKACPIDVRTGMAWIDPPKEE